MKKEKQRKIQKPSDRLRELWDQETLFSILAIILDEINEGKFK